MWLPKQFDRILFVDDDARLLAALRRRLRGRYRIVTATGPEAGLELLGRDTAFAVIVADMNMPGMDGAAFLEQAREICPHAVRMMLTGNTDLETAVRAVNTGGVFRFMTKPCPPEEMQAFLDAGLEFFGLLQAEHRAMAAEETARAKGQFLCTVSHELRTPLSSLRCAAELLLDELDPAVRSEFVDRILHESTRLEGVVDAIMKLAEIDDRAPGDFEPLDVVAMVEGLAVDLLLEDRIRIEAEGASDSAVRAPAEIKVALEEVLANACKFSDETDPITVRLVGDDDWLFVTVTDLGDGVDPELEDRIFEPFVQCVDVLTDKPRGMGLGLAMASKVVSKIGGAIDYKREDDRSSFRIQIPRCPSAIGAPQSPPQE